MHYPDILSVAASARIPTKFGEFTLVLFNGFPAEAQHIAFIHGEVRGQEGVLVRVHSECITGDVFRSVRCDCGEQLAASIEMIGQEPCGVIVYLRQEGRGIGLFNKLKSYNLQDTGLDTVEANEALGFAPDERDFGCAAAMLRVLEVKSIRLLTNNPRKVQALQKNGIPVLVRVPLVVGGGPENRAYLRAKATKLGHHLEQVWPNDQR